MGLLPRFRKKKNPTEQVVFAVDRIDLEQLKQRLEELESRTPKLSRREMLERRLEDRAKRGR